MGMFSAIAGGVMQGFGTGIAGNAASQRRKALFGVADTPGVDPNTVYGQAFDAGLGNFDKAANLARQNNQFSTEELNKMLEQSIPGYNLMQKQAADTTNSFLKGELPPDVQAAILRSSAAKALSGGYGGSPAGRNLTARDLGLTSLDLINRGQQYRSGIIGSTPMARLQGTSDLLNINPADLFGHREQERTLGMQARTNAIEAPTKSEIWGRYLQQQGQQLQGASGQSGSSAMMGGIMSAFCWVARAAFGDENPEWIEFRRTLLDYGPAWLIKAYVRHGQKLAAWMADKPMAKSAMRFMMRRYIAWHRKG